MDRRTLEQYLAQAEDRIDGAQADRSAARIVDSEQVRTVVDCRLAMVDCSNELRGSLTV